MIPWSFLSGGWLRLTRLDFEFMRAGLISSLLPFLLPLGYKPQQNFTCPEGQLCGQTKFTNLVNRVNSQALIVQFFGRFSGLVCLRRSQHDNILWG